MNQNNDALSNILGSLLSDPSAQESIGKVMDMLQGANSSAPSPLTETAPDADNPVRGDDMSGIFGAIGNMKSGTDASLNLLDALRPYLRPSRASRIGTVIRLMQLSKVAPLLGSDLFMQKGDTKGQV